MNSLWNGNVWFAVKKSWWNKEMKIMIFVQWLTYINFLNCSTYKRIHTNTSPSIKNVTFLAQTFHTYILQMATVVFIPSTMRAIPNVWFFAIASNIVKQNGTNTIIKTISNCIRSSETQLTANNITVSNMPVIIADCTPAEVWIEDFDSSTDTGTWTTQSYL